MVLEVVARATVFKKVVVIAVLGMVVRVNGN